MNQRLVEKREKPIEAKTFNEHVELSSLSNY